jgi:hypothetical protein
MCGMWGRAEIKVVVDGLIEQHNLRPGDCSELSAARSAPHTRFVRQAWRS